MTKITSLLFLSLFIFSCNSEKTESNTEKSNTSETECMYTLTDKVELEWTAFKTTEKIAVKGSFDEIKVMNDRKSDQLSNLIIETKFEITPNSINSGNPIRDEKLKEIFFKNFESSETIKGYFEECKGDNSEGKAIVNLTMNDISHQVMMNYKAEGTDLKLHGGFDLLNWKTENSIDALHEACFDLHKGKDGVSKTWSTMELDIFVILKKECK